MDNEEARNLIKRIAANDKEALRMFMQKIAGKVKSIGNNVLRDAMLAEDVLNFVVFQIWTKAAQICEYERVLGYINAIAYNYALDMKRKQNKYLPLFDTVSNPENIEQVTDVKIALEHLPDEERTILLYKIEAGLSFQKIAHLTGLSKKMVYIRYNRAIKTLKKYFQE